MNRLNLLIQVKVMTEKFVLVVEGLDALNSINDIPPRILSAARIAVNDTTRSSYADAGRQIQREVKFPARYVTGKSGRLSIKKFATNSDLESIIAARTRATSLARFVKGAAPVGGARRRAGVRVEVKPGSVVRLPGAFLIRLRAGTETNLDTKSNLGLAVRTKNGRPPPGYKPLQIAPNLWLLYGPSVAQVFHSERNNGGVANDLSPKIAEKLEREFLRQMRL